METEGGAVHPGDTAPGESDEALPVGELAASVRGAALVRMPFNRRGLAVQPPIRQTVPPAAGPVLRLPALPLVDLHEQPETRQARGRLPAEPGIDGRPSGQLRRRVAGAADSCPQGDEAAKLVKVSAGRWAGKINTSPSCFYLKMILRLAMRWPPTAPRYTSNAPRGPVKPASISFSLP